MLRERERGRKKREREKRERERERREREGERERGREEVRDSATQHGSRFVMRTLWLLLRERGEISQEFEECKDLHGRWEVLGQGQRGGQTQLRFLGSLRLRESVDRAKP